MIMMMHCIVARYVRGHYGHVHIADGVYVGPRGGVYDYNARGQRNYL